jgi:hypothetical protein
MLQVLGELSGQETAINKNEITPNQNLYHEFTNKNYYTAIAIRCYKPLIIMQS